MYVFAIIFLYTLAGISFNVSTQEYRLVERCLTTDDQQLLEALAPDPLLGPELLTLDDAAFKSQLADIVSGDLQSLCDSDVVSCVADSPTNSMANSSFIKSEQLDESAIAQKKFELLPQVIERRPDTRKYLLMDI